VHDADPSQGNAVMLAYAVPDSDVIDVMAVCDRDAGVFEIAFYTGDTSGSVPDGARSELVVGAGDRTTSLPGRVQQDPLHGMIIVARSGLPPTFVADWAGKRVTLAGRGVATTLLARPARTMINDFLDRCRR
jgi:hypothetical protein